MRLLPLMVSVSLTSAVASAQLLTPEPPRGWKTTAGQSFTASVVSFDGTTVIFRMPAGQRTQAAAATLSSEDQTYLAEWQKKQPIKVVLPDVVGVETANIKAEVVSEDPVGERYVYRTEHFEFESQGKFSQSLLREVARNFEATYELLKALPWGIDPKPASGERFKARLLKDKGAYYGAGGPPNSAGVYMSRTETFLVPFESIGVKLVGKSFTKDEDFDYSTMVHELTHQMMHYWLDLLPQWIVEGTAEYTSTLPLRTGKFRVSAAKNGLKDYTEFLKKRAVGGMPTPYPLEKLFPVTNEEWNEILTGDPTMSRRLYFTSYLLVYYFMHLDGQGDGQRFVRYFREVGRARKSVEEYKLAMAGFMNQAGVEKLPGGRFRYPAAMTPPPKPAEFADEAAQNAFQKKTLQILLDGRSEADLMKQIRSAYTRLGIRL
uniref:SLA1 homology domain-containing protein n=1 Tax=uncultured Verrucomicrobiota bacterium TaxID=156588 RepID=D2DXP2_9BACT|nr:hypothetical protein [uncultured Verrucomicrobiota bacterium]